MTGGETIATSTMDPAIYMVYHSNVIAGPDPLDILLYNATAGIIRYSNSYDQTKDDSQGAFSKIQDGVSENK